MAGTDGTVPFVKGVILSKLLETDRMCFPYNILTTHPVNHESAVGGKLV